MNVVPIFSTSESIIKLLIACVIGSIIGFERERNHRPAGLRTHLIVCMGSCLSMVISIYFFATYYSISSPEITRLSQGVLSGIGFLGAGTIIRDGNRVKGLTTAASLWGVACLGLSIGAGLYVIAITVFVLLMIILIILAKFEEKFIKYKKLVSMRFKVSHVKVGLGILNECKEKYQCDIKDIDIKHEIDGDLVSVIIKLRSESQYLEMVNEITNRPNIYELNAKVLW